MQHVPTGEETCLDECVNRWEHAEASLTGALVRLERRGGPAQVLREHGGLARRQARDERRQACQEGQPLLLALRHQAA